MKTMLVSPVVVLLVGLWGAACWAFPGPPLTLVSRWEESHLVVLADVVSTDDRQFGQRAVLLVREALKGGKGKRTKTIDVFTICGGCPYPFTFRKGQRVLAFLEFHEERKMYHPYGYPEGCIEVDAETYPVYAGALKKLPAILEDADESARDRRLLDWYVDCATRPATRKDGVVGINRLRGKKRPGMTGDPLTSAQKARLAAAILGERPPGHDTRGVVRVLGGYESRALDRYLLESLRRSHEAGWSDLTRTAVEELPVRLGIELQESTRQRLDEWGDLLSLVYYNIDRVQEPKRFEQEKKRYHILWGSLSLEIYYQCKDAIDGRHAAKDRGANLANSRAPN